nr:restriction endonuclease subunit S [Proteus mirabilis]
MSTEKLPEGWVQCELSMLGNIVTGKTPSTKELSYFGGDIPFIKPGDLEFGGNINTTADTLTDKGLTVVPSLPPSSLVVTCIGNLGKVGITTKRSATNQQINSLIPNPRLCVKFIYYQMLTLKPWLESQSVATTIAIVNKGKFSQAPIKVPAVAEQKIIAEKLDTLLAQVDTTKARLEQVPQILKRFRQAVLTEAISGELTKHLIQDKKYEVTLDKIASIIDPHPSHRTPKIDDTGIPYIGIGDIQPDGKINFTSARKVSVHVFKEHRARYTLDEGDFIFGKIGTLGKACVLPVGLKYTLSANVILIQPIKDKVSSDFLRYFLSSPLTMQEITRQANSTSQAAFGIKKMRAFKCNLPSLVEQHEIVRRIEQLFAYADTIEKQVNNALSRVNNLTQSILAKAFRGELTAQWRVENPDLISGENSAAALLEKIKAERAASGNKKASRKKK